MAASTEDRQNEYLQRSRARAINRFLLGRNIGGSYLLLTLTTPEDTPEDLHSIFRNFIKRMRRRGYPLTYYAVREWNKRGTCQHLHVAVRSYFIPVSLLKAQWDACVGRASWVHIDRITTVKGMAMYLAKYITKGLDSKRRVREIMNAERSDKVVVGRCYWYAYEWIGRGWASLTRLVWKIGSYIHLPYYNAMTEERRTEVKIFTGWKAHKILKWSRSNYRLMEAMGFIWSGLSSPRYKGDMGNGRQGELLTLMV